MVIGFSLTANCWLSMITNIGKFSPHNWVGATSSTREELNQFRTVLCETKRNGTLRNGTLRNGTLRNGTLRNGTLQNGTFRNGTLQMVLCQMVLCEMVLMRNGTFAKWYFANLLLIC